MNEIYPGIYQIEEKGAYGVIKPPENVFVLAGEDGLIYDAGYGNKKAINQVSSSIKKIKDEYRNQGKPFKITRVLPSHWHPDHSSGLTKLRKRLGLKILLTQKTFDVIKSKKTFHSHFESWDVQEDMLSIRNWKRAIKDSFQIHLWRAFYRGLYGLHYLKEADEIIPNSTIISINGEKWVIFFSPGHASDHISMYNEEKGVLFSGDNILRSITTWMGPPDCDIESYMKSIEFIQKLPNLQLILAAHGSPITNPKDRIAEILEHRKERTQKVLDLVLKNPDKGISPSGIVNALYPGKSKMLQNTGRGWICLTLKMLEKQGLIRREKTKRVFLFFPTERRSQTN